MLLEGIYLPLTTPFYPDGRLYLRKLEHNVDRYSRTPASGLMVLGRVGEADSLTDDETRQVLTTAIAVAAKEKVMIAAVGRESVFATLLMADAAATAGYDGIVVRPPAFAFDPALRLETLTYFRSIADRAGLPILLVSEGLSVAMIAELAGHPKIIGAIDSGVTALRMKMIAEGTHTVNREVTVTTVFASATGRMTRQTAAGPGAFVSAETLGNGGTALAVAPPAPALKTRTKKVGFQVLSGTTTGMLEAWKAGASGALPSLGACAPQACCEVWQAHKDGDPALAEEKQQRVERAAAQMEGWRGVAAIKHGCDLNGYYGGRPRLPLVALNGEERANVEREMENLKN